MARRGPGPRWDLLALITLLAGAWLRFHNLNDMEFKADEFGALDLAAQLAGSSWREWPPHGLLSSNLVGNAPLFIWIVSAVWAPTRNPVAVAALVALINTVCLWPLWRWARRVLDDERALLTLAIVAVSPFAVLWSRKIWTQDLLIAGVVAVLWGVEWLRSDKLWRGVACLAWAGLLAGQLHQSGPLALIVLAVVLPFQQPRPRVVRPTTLEGLALASAILLNLFFWLPYASYLWSLPSTVFTERPQADTISPVLLIKVIRQVLPVDLFYFLSDRVGFLEDRLRWLTFYSVVVSGAPLLLFGLWRWVRAPRVLGVLGLWWAGIILLFALARIPTYPFYALILTPLPALLVAGGFDPPVLPTWAERLLRANRVAYVIALFALSLSVFGWIHDRGGVAGEYGISYRVREAQARAIVSGSHVDDAFELNGSELVKLECGPVPEAVEWIERARGEPSSRVPPASQLCETWLVRDGRLSYAWLVQ